MRRPPLLPVLALLCGLARAAAATPTGDDIASQVISDVNQERRLAGCPELVLNDRLTLAAQRQSASMARSHQLSHVGSDGKALGPRLDAAGYDYARAAENAAAGEMSVSEVVRSWMDSPPHRANILNCRLRETGVGISRSDDELGLYWAQVFGTRR